jgi:hypothetical protein
MCVGVGICIEGFTTSAAAGRLRSLQEAASDRRFARTAFHSRKRDFTFIFAKKCFSISSRPPTTASLT